MNTVLQGLRQGDTDSVIIGKVISGDIQCFEKLIIKYQRKILGLCYSLVGKDLAEDAAQETFLKAYNSLSQFKGQSSFGTWLFRISYNHCLNMLAKKKRERTVSLDELTDSQAERVFYADKQLEPDGMESREFVDAVFEQMSSEEIYILTLREIEGLSYKEIAGELGVSVDAVKVRLFRARRSFLERAKKIV